MTVHDAVGQSLLLCEKTQRYAKVVDRDLINVWADELQDIPAEFIKPAFAKWRKDSPDWPTPSEIRSKASLLIADHEYANRKPLEIVMPELPPHVDEPVTEETKSYIRGILDKWASRHTMPKSEPMQTRVAAPISGPQDTETQALLEAQKARLSK